MLGEHATQVLAELLGKSGEEIAVLSREELI